MFFADRCGNDTIIVIDHEGITGVETKPEGEPALTVSPDPVRSVSEITYYLKISGQIEITLTGMNGDEKTLFEGRAAAGWHTLPLVASGLASGVYFVRIVHPGGTLSRKITVGK